MWYLNSTLLLKISETICLTITRQVPKVSLMEWNFEAMVIFFFLFWAPFWCIFRPIGVQRVLLLASSTWKIWELIIIWTKIIDTHNHIGVKSCSHGMKFWSKGDCFCCFWAFFWCIFRLIRVLRVELSASSIWNLWEWIIIWTKITNTHNHASAKNYPNGMKFWSKGDFFPANGSNKCCETLPINFE